MIGFLAFLATLLPYTLCLDPEVDMNAEQIIKYWKYPFEEYTTQTEDGYVLTLFRIKHGREPDGSPPGPPFLLAHGLGASAEHWLMNPPESSPAFILADSGFDVWLINFRGAKNSKKHVKFKPDSSAFWNFCWDQMAEHDLPAAVDTVRRVNGAQKVYYVGHSQGTTVLFGKLAREPVFSSKIARFFALAPITTARHMRGPMTALYFIHSILQNSNDHFGAMEMVLPTQYLAAILSRWVCPYARFGLACESFISAQGGHSGIGVFNQSRTPVYFSHYPGSSSLRNFAHWGQMVWRDATSLYDHGSTQKNQIHYNQSAPPSYDFTAIRNVSIHLFYSSNDNVATADDVEKEMIGKQLGKDVVKEAINVPGYSHNDFIAGMTLKTVIMDRIIEVIRKEDSSSQVYDIKQKKAKKEFFEFISPSSPERKLAMHRTTFLVAALLAVSINTQTSDVPVATGNRFVHYNLLSVISTDEQPLTANISDSIWCQATLNEVPLPVVRSTFIKDPQRREFEPDVNNTNHRATLKIGPVVINNMGKYKCTIEINHNQSSIMVASNIMVYSAPFFHTNRSMKMVAGEVYKKGVTADKLYATEGDPMEIHCPAVGYPKPMIIWYKEDELLVIDGMHISASNDSTVLTIDEFAESDVGVYRCTASNEFPIRPDMDAAYHEAGLTQEVAIGSPYGWIYPLLVILVILLLLFITIHACEREKLLRTPFPASSAYSTKKYEIVSST